MNAHELHKLPPITEKNEFFDPAAFDTDVVGFFEEYIAEDPSSGYGFKLLGNRIFTELPTRKLGVDGRIVVMIVEPMCLQKGHKKILLRASKKRPIRAYAMIQTIGRFK